MASIDELLGIDPASESDRLASGLVGADFGLIDQLVAARRLRGLTQAQVADAMGCSGAAVSDIETMSTDPRLSMLRRYAMAVGAVVTHEVNAERPG